MKHVFYTNDLQYSGLAYILSYRKKIDVGRSGI